MGALGSITDLFAAEAASGVAWFLYLFILNGHNWNTYSFPFTSHFDSNVNQDQLHLHLTPASSWARVRASSSSNFLIPSQFEKRLKWVSGKVWLPELVKCQRR